MKLDLSSFKRLATGSAEAAAAFEAFRTSIVKLNVRTPRITVKQFGMSRRKGKSK